MSAITFMYGKWKYIWELEHDKTDKMTLRPQQRLRWALEYAQSDHSLHCLHEEGLDP